MSFNIRYGSANDGKNRWEFRKELVAKTIQDAVPDLVGTQETLPFQAKFLQEKLRKFDYVGRSRETNDNGEQCGILIKRSRFAVLEQGHFWLSETPDVPASKSWDSSLPRMVTWVKLYDKKSKKVFFFLNTHFDHIGSEARLRSARLIAKKIESKFHQSPVILAGDFNSGPSSKPISILSESLTDTFASTHSNQAPNTGTFSNFRGKRSGARIDYIFSDKCFEIVDAAIDYSNLDGRYPSDHYPVTAVLSIKR